MTIPELIHRSAWYLQDYADLWVAAELDDHPEGKRMLVELKDLAQRMAELDRVLDGTGGDTPVEAMAKFVADAIELAGEPRALYYKACGRRFRIGWVGYRQLESEEMVGIYSPGVATAYLIDDMREMMEAKP